MKVVYTMQKVCMWKGAVFNYIGIKEDCEA